MSEGPATKMYEALRWIACEENTWPESRDDARCAAGTCLEDYPVTTATLEAMDAAAAAEEWARQHEAEVEVQRRAILMDRAEEDLDVLLAAALRLVVQRRKEAGHG